MKRKFVIATAAAAAVIGGGTLTGVAFADEDGEQAAAQTAAQDAQPGQRSSVQLGAGADDRSDAQENAGKASAAKVSAADAAAAALKQQPGTVTSVDLEDKDNGALFWDVDVLGKDGTWHGVTVDPGNGAVLGRHAERGDDADDRGTAQVRRGLKGTSVDAAEAARRGAAKGTVTSVDLEHDDRHGTGPGTVWEVDAVDEHGAAGEFTVDAHTGKVTTAKDYDGSDDKGGDDEADRDEDKGDHDRGDDDKADHDKADHDKGDGHDDGEHDADDDDH